MLDEPLEDNCILIGCLIFDINGYQGNFSTNKEQIEVALIGRVLENGKENVAGFWAETDENGYFCLTNVPPGEYAIKGFRTRLFGIGELNIANELISPQRNYFELLDRSTIPLTGNLFDTKANNRVVNFKYNLFTLFAEGIIELQRLDQLREVKLTSGEEANGPPVPFYFLDKYQGSSWTKYLELQITN